MSMNRWRSHPFTYLRNLFFLYSLPWSSNNCLIYSFSRLPAMFAKFRALSDGLALTADPWFASALTSREWNLLQFHSLITIHVFIYAYINLCLSDIIYIHNYYIRILNNVDEYFHWHSSIGWGYRNSYQINDSF